ncbi:pilus assembly protein PilP [Aliivibrio kagoshimensis]|uniref:pilus assembly protein PilP n=1 Tax=Aliivibrio kagoshimensis TaxID=2910230 RepID=UPI003D14A839
MPWSSLELDEFMDWPIRAQLLLLAALMILLQLAIAWWWLLPLQEALMDSKNREHQHVVALQSERVQLQSLDDELMPVKDLSMRYQGMMNQFPEQSELSELLSLIHSLGNRHHLTFIRFGWGKREKSGYLSTIPIHIELRGEFHAIGRFSEALAALPTMVTIQQLSLNSNGDGQDIAVKMEALTYQADQDITLGDYLTEQVELTPVIDNVEIRKPPFIIHYQGSMKRSPFYEKEENRAVVIEKEVCLRSGPNSIKVAITDQALSTIQVKGVLLMESQYVGWLQPKGSPLIKVYKGERIGPNYGEIIQINHDGLLVKEFKVAANGCWFESLLTMPIKE